MTDGAKHTVARPYRILLVGIGVVTSLAVLYAVRDIVLATLVGVMIGVLLAPTIAWLERRARLPHSVSVGIVVLLLLAAIAGIGFGVYSVVSDQAQRMREQGPSMVARLREQFDYLQERFSWLAQQREQVDPGAIVQKGVQMVVGGALAGGRGVAAVLLVFMIAIFTAANAQSYFRGALTVFSPAWRPKAEHLGRGSARVLRRWFGSQLLVVSISGVVMAIALKAVGNDYWLLLGLLTILLDLVPFVGALVVGAIAVLVTLATDPGKIWAVIAICIAVQQIENHITLPIIMKERVKLPEAHLLVFMLAMGAAFGFPGVFVAPPLFAVLHYLYREAYLPWIESRTPRRRALPRSEEVASGHR